MKNKVIISLTSYPARIGTIHKVIKSLLNQTYKADKIVLWLADSQFPTKENELPQQLLQLKSDKFDIDWCEDLKSYKKLIPTLELYTNDISVTVDDDNIYPNCWLEKLINCHKKYPKDVCCHRVTKFLYKNKKFKCIAGGYDYYKNGSYLNKLVGLGGVLYPPNCFYKDILNKELFQKLAPTNDDQWFWFQAILNNRKIRVVDNPEIEAHYIEGSQDCGLSNNINDNGEKRFWKDFANLEKYYPQAISKLKMEYKSYKFKTLSNLFNIFFWKTYKNNDP